MDGTVNGDKARAALDRIREAEAVRDELMAALHGAGITLPSLRLDPVAYGDEKPRMLVDLGRCNIRTARQIAAALRKAHPGTGRA